MTSYRGLPLASVSLLAWLAASCGGSSPAPEPEPEPVTTGEEVVEAPPPPPPPGHVRVIHAAFDPIAAAIGVGFDGAEPVITELAYQQASAYVELPSGEHSVSLVGADGAEILSWTPPALAEDGWTTLILSSTTDMPVEFAASADVATAPGETMAAVRVFHAIDGLDAVDVCLAGESPRADGILIFANVAPSSFGGSEGAQYAELPVNGSEVTIQLRTANPRGCHGRIQGVARFTPTGGARYTVVAAGRNGGRPRIDREMLFCADPPATETSCTAVLMTAR